MSRYAEKTDVPIDRSRREIEQILERYGATQFFYGTEATRAVIGFSAHSRTVRFVLPLPELKDFKEFLQKGHYYKTTRTAEQQKKAYEQALRTRWRCLTLAIKAKLEVVESGIATFEEEFLNNILTYSGQTVGEAIRPKLQESYASGKNIPLLLGAP